MFQSGVLYGLFPLVGESVRACLSKSDVYAFHVVERECTTHVSINCIEEGTVRIIVLGTVAFETSWEEDVSQVLTSWHACSNTINGPRVLVVDEIGPFSAVLSQKVVDGMPLVVPIMGVDWLRNYVRGVSYRHFSGVEPYGVKPKFQKLGEVSWLE